MRETFHKTCEPHGNEKPCQLCVREAYAAEVVEEFLPPPPRTLRTLQALQQAGVSPYKMVVVAGKQMEIISMPFIQEGPAFRGGGCGIGVMIREKDDPTTMREWSIPARDVRRALKGGR